MPRLPHTFQPPQACTSHLRKGIGELKLLWFVIGWDLVYRRGLDIKGMNYGVVIVVVVIVVIIAEENRNAQ